MVAGFGDGLSEILEHGQPRPRTTPTPTAGAAEGTIIDVTVDKATFAVDGDTQHFYGPAPFGRTSTPPQAGDKCLIVFVGNGIDRAWITSWSAPS